MARPIFLFVVLAALVVAPEASAATPPTAYVAGVSTSAVEISWTQGINLCFERYEVQYRVAGASSWGIAAVFTDVDAGGTAVAGLQAGTAYEFRILNVDCLLSTASNTVEATTNRLTVTAEAKGKDTVAVQWSASQDHCFNHYKVEYRRQGESPWTEGATITNVSNTTSSIAGLAEGTTYEVRVVDFDCWGSGASPVATATTFMFWPQLTSTVASARVWPGAIATFVLEARNLGNADDTLTLSASEPPAGWDARFSPAAVTLSPGASAYVDFVVLGPASYTGLRAWTASVQATGSDGTATPVIQVTAELAVADLRLVASDIRMMPAAPRAGDNVTVEATVRNVGSAAAAGVTVRMQVGGNLEEDTIDLAEGGSGVASFTFTVAAVTQVVTVTVDPDNWIAEFDESDNSAQLTISATLLRPDLWISTADLVVDPASPGAGDLVAVQVKVRNVGVVTASDFIVRLRVGSSVDDQLASVPADGEQLVLFSFVASGGSQEVVAEADPDNRIAELNEMNNLAARTVFGVFALPDLQISAQDIDVSAADPEVGSEVELRATVWNRGTENASNVVIRIRTGTTAVEYTVNATAGLGETFTFAVPMDGGSVLVVVEADPDNLIREYSEFNNRAEVTVFARAADLTLSASDIEVPEGVIVEGDRVALSVTVHNVGNRAAGPFDVFCLIGGHFGGRTSLQWLDGAGATARVNFTWTAVAGAFSVELTVDIGGSVIERDEQNNRAILNLDVDARPFASLVGPPSTVVGTPVQFGALESADLDGSVAAYFFDFGDGTNSSWVTSGTVQHTYWVEGTYEVRLWVRDNEGAASEFTALSLSVGPAPPPVFPAAWQPLLPAMWILMILAGSVVITYAVRRRARGQREAAARALLGSDGAQGGALHTLRGEATTQAAVRPAAGAPVQFEMLVPPQAPRRTRTEPAGAPSEPSAARDESILAPLPRRAADLEPIVRPVEKRPAWAESIGTQAGPAVRPLGSVIKRDGPAPAPEAPTPAVPEPVARALEKIIPRDLPVPSREPPKPAPAETMAPPVEKAIPREAAGPAKEAPKPALAEKTIPRDAPLPARVSPRREAAERFAQPPEKPARPAASFRPPEPPAASASGTAAPMAPQGEPRPGPGVVKFAPLRVVGRVRDANRAPAGDASLASPKKPDLGPQAPPSESPPAEGAPKPAPAPGGTRVKRVVRRTPEM